MKNKKINFKNSKNELINSIHKYNYKIPFNSFYKLRENDINSNSWFDIKKAKLKDNIDINFFNNNNNENIIKCKKVTILPTNTQKEILLSWFESYRKMYNETLNIIKQLIFENNKNKFNFRFIRTNKMKEIKYKLIDETNIKSHILDGAIKLACTSYKSARSNFKNGNIKKYIIRPIKQSKKSKIMDIEKCYFYKDGFCKTNLGSMKTTDVFDFKSIDSDCKLHYNKNLNRFTLLVPIKEKCIKKNINNKFISIDPGIKTFITGLSNDSVYKIGENLRDTIKVNINKIDKLAKINNKKCRKRMTVLRKKNNNKITDLHWKTINYLIKTEKINSIFIGNWSTKNISSNEKYLDDMSKRFASSLRFYDFLLKLKFKCEEYNVNFKLIDESYTSKVCSFCKETSSIGNDRKLKCKCNLNLDRDINGCVNILLKSLS
jgi:IS605 OrfB family transposase